MSVNANPISIKKLLSSFDSQQAIALRTLFEAVQTDLTALRTALNTAITKLNTDTAQQNAVIQAINDAFDTAIAKLNADAANSQLDDTDYAIADQTAGFDEDYASAGSLTLTS